MLEKLLSLFGLGRKRATLVVSVASGRRACGTLRALDQAGRDLLGGAISVAARADEALARAHGNPARDVMLPYGDPACGTYLLVAIDRLDGAPESQREEIGDCQLLFEPSEGDAARAESGGRLLLALHGGRLGADNHLRPTAGGLRVSSGDLATLLRVVSTERQWRLELREEPLKMLPPALSSEAAGTAVDPPIPYSAEARRAIERRGPASASDDDSWRSRHDDDWRDSRDTYSSSGPAVAAATGAAVGAAAAREAEAKGARDEEHELQAMDIGPEATKWEPESSGTESTAGEAHEGASDSSSATSY